MVLIVEQTESVDPGRVASVSTMLMGWDYALFGSYVPFALQAIQSDYVDSLLYVAYLGLGAMISLILLILLVAGKQWLIRAFVLSYAATFMLAVPVWYMFPAVTPYELYGREDLLPVSKESAQYVVAQEGLASISERVEYLQTTLTTENASRPEIGHYHVPTSPSMHVTWGTLILLFAFMLSKLLGAVVSVWYMFNLVGSFYTLQHYVVDGILGIVIALVGFITTRALLKHEHKYLDVPDQRYSFLNVYAQESKLLRMRLSVGVQGVLRVWGDVLKGGRRAQ